MRDLLIGRNLAGIRIGSIIEQKDARASQVCLDGWCAGDFTVNE